MSIDIFTSPLYANGVSMRTTTGSIPYLMLWKGGSGYSEEFTPSLVNSSFVAIVRWSQANAFVTAMLGSHQLNGGKIRRLNPEPHPFFPKVYCIGLRLQEGLGEFSSSVEVPGALSYEYAVYQCTFSPLTYDIKSDADADRQGEICRYVTRDRKLTGESIQITGQIVFPNQRVFAAIAGGSDGQTLPQSIINVGSTAGFPLSGSIVIVTTTGAATVSYTGLTATSFTGCTGGTGTLATGQSVGSSANNGFVPLGTNPVVQTSYQSLIYHHEYVPDAAMQSLLAKATQYINTVNVVPFDMLYGTYTVGTVLYVGISNLDRIPMSPAGNTLWRISHSFIHRAVGWNTALRLSNQAPPGEWAPIKALSLDGRTTWDPYLVAFDHSQLFNP